MATINNKGSDDWLHARTSIRQELKFLPGCLTNVIVEYFSQTVALSFRFTVVKHGPDIVCYKAMDFYEWYHVHERMNHVKAALGKLACRKHITFLFDCATHSERMTVVFDNITVSNNVQLCIALEAIAPLYLGNDIDVFQKVIDHLDDEFLSQLILSCPAPLHM
jgi:hypothetical protein